MTTDHGPQRQPASVPQIEAQVKQHLSMLAPHVKERRTGQLLCAASEELTRLRAENERLLKWYEQIHLLACQEMPINYSQVLRNIADIASDALRCESDS